jgi:hypothetical protein
MKFCQKEAERKEGLAREALQLVEAKTSSRRTRNHLDARVKKTSGKQVGAHCLCATCYLESSKDNQRAFKDKDMNESSVRNP